MTDGRLPPAESRRAGYEVRDLDVSGVAFGAVVLAALGAILLVLLWAAWHEAVPDIGRDGASPPSVMPGEPSVNARVTALPKPRLDPLEPLEAEPPSYRSSRPRPDAASPTRHPEDLRADRQPELRGYGWVVEGKVARIPIDRAMDAVVAAERAKRQGAGK